MQTVYNQDLSRNVKKKWTGKRILRLQIVDLRNITRR
jgi:hypothetical protein